METLDLELDALRLSGAKDRAALVVIEDLRVDDVASGVLMDNAGRSAMLWSNPTENGW